MSGFSFHWRDIALRSGYFRGQTPTFDRQDGMQFDAALRSADLKVIHIEEADARDTDDNSAKIVQLPGA